MDISFSSQDPLEIACDILIVPVGKDDGLAWSESAAAADSALGGNLAATAVLEQFKGKSEATVVLPTFGTLAAARVMLVGIGEIDDVTPSSLAKAIGAALREARARGASSVAVALPAALPGIAETEALTTAALAGQMALYRFDAYRGTGTKEERTKEYERLVRTGGLESLRVPAPDPAKRPAILVIAVASVGFGLLLLGLILAGGLL